MITSLGLMADLVRSSGRRHKIAVAWAQDPNTVGSLHRAVSEGFAEALMIGQKEHIMKTCEDKGLDPELFTIIESAGDKEAAETAVSLTRTGEADIAMKGLVGTDKFLRAIMDRERGLLPPGAVMSYVCAVEIPAYHKLLFITDTAVIPFPDLDQKVAMAEYAITMAKRFGIEMPRVALIGASEKVSDHFPGTLDYSIMCKMAGQGQISSCVMDGPVDLFLACDPESIRIKGIDTPLEGDADILLFPSLEACNPFYKSLMLFGGGELAGMICGTTKPVVLMSRSESELSKYYCVALACLMASQKTDRNEGKEDSGC